MRNLKRKPLGNNNLFFTFSVILIPFVISSDTKFLDILNKETSLQNRQILCHKQIGSKRKYLLINYLPKNIFHRSREQQTKINSGKFLQREYNRFTFPYKTNLSNSYFGSRAWDETTSIILVRTYLLTYLLSTYTGFSQDFSEAVLTEYYLNEYEARVLRQDQ